MTQDRIAERNGVRLRYRLSGEGIPLLLVHGVGSRLDHWQEVIEALGPGYRTLAYDQRGHGLSDKPKGPYSLDELVQDLQAVADRAGFRQFHLAGFSLGGIVAQGYALAHPERLMSLALISTVAGRTAEEREAVLARLRMVESGIPGGHFQSSIDRWFTEAFQRRRPDAIAAMEEENRKLDPAAYAAAYHVLATSDLADRLAEIRVPTLVATGDGDVGSNPRMARLMQSRIPGAQLEILPGLRHSILTEAPERVARLLAGFIATVPRPNAPAR
jgi:3-oxoadipate enol-lactonase